MKLLSELCKIHAPSGEEYMLTEYILNYIQIEEQNWKVLEKHLLMYKLHILITDWEYGML